MPSPPSKSFSSSTNKRITEEQGYTPPTSPRPGSLRNFLPNLKSGNTSGLAESVKEKIAASLGKYYLYILL